MVQKESKAALKRLVKEREDSLAEVKAQLAELEAEEARRKSIKENYKRNDVPDRVKYNWEAICKALFAVMDEKGRISSAEAETIKKEFSLNLGPDPAQVYNCPQCGASDCLYVGQFGDFYAQTEAYAVVCSHCDFHGPEISDYGEAWCEFEYWLCKRGYLKD